MRLLDDRSIATTIAARRVIARVVLEQGETHGLLAFGAADNHLHATLATDRASAGSFAHDVACSLRWRLDLGAHFETARIRPLHDQRHAYNAFHYVQRQDERHRLDLDEGREGTSLPDLLALRVLPTSIVARVREHLPRLRREDLLAHFPPGILDDLQETSIEVLSEAATAAFALPHLRGPSAETTRARRAAIHAAGPHVSNAQLSECLKVGRRAVQILRAQEREPLAIRAVTSQASRLARSRDRRVVPVFTPSIVAPRAHHLARLAGGDPER